MWARLGKVLPEAYVSTWASTVVLSDLEGRTVREAITAGVPFKTIWRAAWRQLELPETLK